MGKTEVALTRVGVSFASDIKKGKAINGEGTGNSRGTG